jgi:regulatory protein
MSTRPSYTLKEATRKAELYCAYQDRCHQDVIQKLREIGMIPEAIDQIMGHLIEENFLNEERFARSFARGKFRIKLWGRLRITRELKRRNISLYIIRMAMEELPEPDYIQTLKKLANKRLSELKGLDILSKKRKLYDYLVYRGWENSLILEVMEELLD